MKKTIVSPRGSRTRLPWNTSTTVPSEIHRQVSKVAARTIRQTSTTCSAVWWPPAIGTRAITQIRSNTYASVRVACWRSSTRDSAVRTQKASLAASAFPAACALPRPIDHTFDAEKLEPRRTAITFELCPVRDLFCFRPRMIGNAALDRYLALAARTLTSTNFRTVIGRHAASVTEQSDRQRYRLQSRQLEWG